MNLRNLLTRFENCPCGRVHTAEIKAIEIGHGCRERTPHILSAHGFPKKLLVVADRNTIRASGDVLDRLTGAGFDITCKLYENFREPLVSFVNEIVALSVDVDGILSIGSGSLNDICRRAALLANKEFAIFATAPSMDGFASGTAPIIENTNIMVEITFPIFAKICIVFRVLFIKSSVSFFKGILYFFNYTIWMFNFQ